MPSHLNQVYEFRESLTRALETHLIGPHAPDELLAASPLDTYSLGFLHPEESGMEEVLDDNAVEASHVEDAASDEVVSLANRQFPSSMGLSFAVRRDGGSDASIGIDVDFATYEPTGGEQWRRTGHTHNGTVVPIVDREAGEARLNGGLVLGWRVRPSNSAGESTVTVYLRNENKPALNRAERPLRVCFQPEIRVCVMAGVVFVERPDNSSAVFSEADKESDALLYGHTRNLAIGHGCAVTWPAEGPVAELKTTFFPVHEVRRAESNPAIVATKDGCLDMRATGRVGKPAVISSMRQLVAGYESWVEDRRTDSALLPDRLRVVATRHLDECSRAAGRMRKGIDVLASQEDPAPYEAFKLMSEVMVLQRERSETVLAGRKPTPGETVKAEWRPFQLAFILQCLLGLVDEESEERDVADLLWFPTGGGKTEAYLGLIAFDLMLRRLRGRPHGVAALMRYTLRLLTTQQFERAALMIACCESLRRSDARPIPGSPFSIGLYVGGEGTPNSRENAKKALKVLRATPSADVSKFGNPIQVSVCVWCGEGIAAENYNEDDDIVACCPVPDCLFHRGLPWYVVDEDIFERRPDLIIGTIDKFAMLALTEKAGALFNRVEGAEPGLDLVVQDELHLISGPLGTIAGLYEVAIDELGRRLRPDGSPGPRPKLIASTATIRRASEQVDALFDRKVAQFPPPGIDSRDSYFSVESPPERQGTRRYVGVMAPGLSQATTLIRVYAKLFHESALGAWPGEVRDAYWTLVAYFNSLRILASANLLMIDDVGERMDLLASGGARVRQPASHLIELTSRASSREIPEFLRQLRDAYGSGSAVETVLATNMISVGVDIDRLGLMVMAGQPQSTAEYIQSSSRVGRRDPGLVITVYNAARSRDKSHYETFQNYHAAFYRQVEGTSVTPFSPRARSRALAAVLVIECRFLIPELRANDAAGRVVDHLDRVKALAAGIVRRAARVDPAEMKNVRNELDDFIDGWVSLAEMHGERLLYHSWSPKEEKPTLLSTSVDGDVTFAVASVLTSMRDVDRTCELYEAFKGAGNGSRKN
jgi:hypothetical protein